MSQFFWVGNHPGLDLLNTAAANDEGEPVELLDDVDALAAWLHEARIVPSVKFDDLATRQRTQLLQWTRRLRDAGRQVVEPGAPRADGAHNLNASVAVIPVRLAYSETGGTATPIDAASPHDQVRLALALAVLEATRLDRSRVRRCGRQGCVLLFLDTSKNNTRRWCDMAVCGNRVKAAAHYHRHHTDVPNHRNSAR